MTVGRPLVAALVAAALAAPHAVRAQAPAAPAPVPLTRTTIELGFVSASGNTSLRTLNAAEQFVFQPAPWKFTQTFAIVNGYTNGTETANTIRFGLRADYAFSGHFRAYALGLYERNRFAGIARRFEEQLGLSYGALIGPRHVLDFEAGAGRNQQTSPAAKVIDYWLGRAAAHYRFTFRPNTYLDEKLELLQSLQSGSERRINSEAALVAPLSSRVAMRFGYVVRFVNSLPDSTVRFHADQTVSAGLQIAF
jgi:putative salt-induced outer membrane protein YdiY